MLFRPGERSRHVITSYSIHYTKLYEADSDERRVAARMALADLPLTAFLDDPLIPYETDEVTRLIADTHDAEAFSYNFV